jgi:hypothetical protein
MPTSRVAIASGIVSEQSGCSVEAARQLLYEWANATDCTVDEVAGMVIDHEIRFD